MKKIAFYASLLAAFTLASCSLFEMDNYEAPKETIQGEVVDIATGEPVLTDQGSEGIIVRLTELSWGDNVQHNPDFNCRPDGTFQNTKLFAGEYNINLFGPFIPLVREDDRGVPLADETQTLKIKGTKKVRFEVEPFLKVEFVSAPMIMDGQIRAEVRVTRAVTEQIFRDKISPMGNFKEEFLDMTDIRLFVSYSSSVGYRARDPRWSSEMKFEGSSFNDKFGEVITIKSIGSIPSGRNIFIRAAARINYDTPRGSGTRRYNYSEPIEVVIP